MTQDDECERMEVNAAPTIQDRLLMEYAIHATSVRTVLRYLEFAPWDPLSEELAWLKQLTPGKFSEDGEWEKSPDASFPCGMKGYLLDNEFCTVQGLPKRKSKLFFDRSCFAPLYEKILKIFQKSHTKKIILTGNAVIGKSWFQVYLLRRLLNETESPLFRFAVRQFDTSFFLMDLQTCQSWELRGRENDIMLLLNAVKKTLYLYEPGSTVDQPPLLTSAPSLSTLSPRPKRIHEYEKSDPWFLYMPVWESNELAVVARAENMNLDDLEDNYNKFGGLILYTLGTKNRLSNASAHLDAQCEWIGKDLLRSAVSDINDDPDANVKRFFCGFLVSYIDIPQDGEEAFERKSFTMTSEYARKKVLEKFSLESAQNRLHMLASHLNTRTNDITGIDLACSVVQMLAVGPSTVKWSYHPVGAQAASASQELLHTKRPIQRVETFDKSMLIYPTDRMFGLIDCVIYVQDAWCAFLTTWHYDRAFKLRSLCKLRGKLGIIPSQSLNLFFVNPVYSETYRKRAKDKYLAKGESLAAPLEANNGEVLMVSEDVTTMWENTHIFVASPEDNDWVSAINSCLG